MSALRLRTLSVLTLVAAALSASASEQPNILWIVAEDMSPTLGCYGDDYATTPHIDRLATESVRYTHAFASAPVCSPSRSCIITGVTAPRLGTHQMRSAFPVPDVMRGFPALLREAGYYTTNNVKTDYNTSSADRIISSSWDESSDTAHWRKRPDKSKPFFSIFNIMTSHQSRSMVWTQERFRREVQSRLSQTEVHNPDEAPVPDYYPTTLVTQRIIARYYDCVTVMDKRVGEILQQLRQDGLADNTIVFFYSDHGSGMPRHKRLLHDSGMHVPLLIRFPSKYAHLAPRDAGETLNQLVSFVDFPPTVLELAGVDIPAYMQGQPFLGENRAERRHVVGHRDRIDEVIDVSRSIRDKRYLYIRNYMPQLSWNQVSAYPDMSEIRHELYRIAESNSMNIAEKHYAGATKPHEELYDCESDPANVVNLAESPKHAETLKQLRRELTASLDQDLGFIPESRMRELAAGGPPYDLLVSAQPEARAAQSAAESLRTKDEVKFRTFLHHQYPSVRYWGALGLSTLDSMSLETRQGLTAALNDEATAVQVAAAATLAHHGFANVALPHLVEVLGRHDLTDVLYATRAIELIGKQARMAIPAMQQVALRAEKLQAADTPAVFAQTGDQDLAMFCSFSANGFLQRIRLNPWQDLINQPEEWTNLEAGEVRVDGTNHEVTMMSKGKNVWITHHESFSDFEMTVDVRMPRDQYNAGIGFRCQVQPNGKPKGYQCEVAEELSGSLYAIGSGGWVWPRGDEQREQFLMQAGDAFRPGHWNHFRVRCEGPHIQIWVNGILTTDVDDTKHSSGRIALQHHGRGGTHFYRNVRIRRIDKLPTE